MNRRALEVSAARFNPLMADGLDADFLRHQTLAAKGASPQLAPIASGTFYAVKMVTGELVCTHRIAD